MTDPILNDAAGKDISIGYLGLDKKGNFTKVAAHRHLTGKNDQELSKLKNDKNMNIDAKRKAFNEVAQTVRQSKTLGGDKSVRRGMLLHAARQLGIPLTFLKKSDDKLLELNEEKIQNVKLYNVQGQEKSEQIGIVKNELRKNNENELSHKDVQVGDSLIFVDTKAEDKNTIYLKSDGVDLFNAPLERSHLRNLLKVVNSDEMQVFFSDDKSLFESAKAREMMLGVIERNVKGIDFRKAGLNNLSNAALMSLGKNLISGKMTTTTDVLDFIEVSSIVYKEQILNENVHTLVKDMRNDGDKVNPLVDMNPGKKESANRDIKDVYIEFKVARDQDKNLENVAETKYEKIGLKEKVEKKKSDRSDNHVPVLKYSPRKKPADFGANSNKSSQFFGFDLGALSRSNDIANYLNTMSRDDMCRDMTDIIASFNKSRAEKDPMIMRQALDRNADTLSLLLANPKKILKEKFNLDVDKDKNNVIYKMITDLRAEIFGNENDSKLTKEAFFQKVALSNPAMVCDLIHKALSKDKDSQIKLDDQTFNKIYNAFSDKLLSDEGSEEIYAKFTKMSNDQIYTTLTAAGNFFENVSVKNESLNLEKFSKQYVIHRTIGLLQSFADGYGNKDVGVFRDMLRDNSDVISYALVDPERFTEKIILPGNVDETELIKLLKPISGSIANKLGVDLGDSEVGMLNSVIQDFLVKLDDETLSMIRDEMYKKAEEEFLRTEYDFVTLMGTLREQLQELTGYSFDEIGKISTKMSERQSDSNLKEVVQLFREFVTALKSSNPEQEIRNALLKHNEALVAMLCNTNDVERILKGLLHQDGEKGPITALTEKLGVFNKIRNIFDDIKKSFSEKTRIELNKFFCPEMQPYVLIKSKSIIDSVNTEEIFKAIVGSLSDKDNPLEAADEAAENYKNYEMCLSSLIRLSKEDTSKIRERINKFDKEAVLNQINSLYQAVIAIHKNGGVESGEKKEENLIQLRNALSNSAETITLAISDLDQFIKDYDLDNPVAGFGAILRDLFEEICHPISQGLGVEDNVVFNRNLTPLLEQLVLEQIDHFSAEDLKKIQDKCVESLGGSEVLNRINKEVIDNLIVVTTQEIRDSLADIILDKNVWEADKTVMDGVSRKELFKDLLMDPKHLDAFSIFMCHRDKNMKAEFGTIAPVLIGACESALNTILGSEVQKLCRPGNEALVRVVLEDQVNKLEDEQLDGILQIVDAEVNVALGVVQKFMGENFRNMLDNANNRLDTDFEKQYSRYEENVREEQTGKKATIEQSQQALQSKRKMIEGKVFNVRYTDRYLDTIKANNAQISLLTEILNLKNQLKSEVVNVEQIDQQVTKLNQTINDLSRIMGKTAPNLNEEISSLNQRISEVAPGLEKTINRLESDKSTEKNIDFNQTIGKLNAANVSAKMSIIGLRRDAYNVDRPNEIKNNLQKAIEDINKEVDKKFEVLKGIEISAHEMELLEREDLKLQEDMDLSDRLGASDKISSQDYDVTALIDRNVQIVQLAVKVPNAFKEVATEYGVSVEMIQKLLMTYVEDPIFPTETFYSEVSSIINKDNDEENVNDAGNNEQNNNQFGFKVNYGNDDSNDDDAHDVKRENVLKHSVKECLSILVGNVLDKYQGAVRFDPSKVQTTMKQGDAAPFSEYAKNWLAMHDVLLQREITLLKASVKPQNLIENINEDLPQDKKEDLPQDIKTKIELWQKAEVNLRNEVEKLVKNNSGKTVGAVRKDDKPIDDVLIKLSRETYHNGQTFDPVKLSLFGEVDLMSNVSMQAIKEASLDTLVGNGPLDTSCGYGAFMVKVMSEYFDGVSDIDKRNMLASMIRNTIDDVPEKNATQEEVDRVNLKNQTRMLGALLKGAGPIMQKQLQQLASTPLPEEFKLALEDMKCRLLPIPDEIVKAQLYGIVKRSGGQIKNIKLVQRIGAASVGESFLCNITDQSGERTAVIKLLRPDVDKRMEREKEIFLKIAKEVPGMENTFKGRLERLEEELDLRLEANNVRRGDVYDKSIKFGGKTHDEVKSMKLYQVNGVDLPVTKDTMVLECAPGNTVSNLIKSRNDEIKRLRKTYLYQGSFVNNVFHSPNEALHQYNVLLAGRDKLLNQQKSLMAMGYKWTEEGLFKKGFYHGDLHAGNIMITDKDPLKLTMIDFGNCTKLTSEEQNHVMSMVYAIGEGQPEVFLEHFRTMLKPDNQSYFDAHSDFIFDLAKEIISKGDIDKTGPVIISVLNEFQKIGLELPPSVFNFAQCEILLDGTIREFNELIKNYDDLLSSFAGALTKMNNGSDKFEVSSMLNELVNNPAHFDRVIEQFDKKIKESKDNKELKNSYSEDKKFLKSLKQLNKQEKSLLGLYSGSKFKQNEIEGFKNAYFSLNENLRQLLKAIDTEIEKINLMASKEGDKSIKILDAQDMANLAPFSELGKGDHPFGEPFNFKALSAAIDKAKAFAKSTLAEKTYNKDAQKFSGLDVFSHWEDRINKLYYNFVQLATTVGNEFYDEGVEPENPSLDKFCDFLDKCKTKLNDYVEHLSADNVNIDTSVVGQMLGEPIHDLTPFNEKIENLKHLLSLKYSKENSDLLDKLLRTRNHLFNNGYVKVKDRFNPGKELAGLFPECKKGDEKKALLALKEAINAGVNEYMRDKTHVVLSEEDLNVIRQFESTPLSKNISNRKDLGSHLADLYKASLAPQEKPKDFAGAIGTCVNDHLLSAAWAVGGKATLDIIGSMIGELFSKSS